MLRTLDGVWYMGGGGGIIDKSWDILCTLGGTLSIPGDVRYLGGTSSQVKSSQVKSLFGITQK